MAGRIQTKKQQDFEMAIREGNKELETLRFEKIGI